MARHRPALITGAAAAPLVCCALLAGFRGSVSSATSALVLVLIVILILSRNMDGIRAFLLSSGQIGLVISVGFYGLLRSQQFTDPAFQ